MLVAVVGTGFPGLTNKSFVNASINANVNVFPDKFPDWFPGKVQLFG